MIKYYDRSISMALTLLIASAIVMIVSPEIRAGDPHYMKMNFDEVPALEIKGYWDSDEGAFIASKIEELPKERRPKLRGEIQKLDMKKSTITMYGIAIEVDDETQFSDSEGGIESLKEGQRIEVSCKIRAQSRWEAGKIKVKDIKDSDKLKCSISSKSVDGKDPDTLEVNGLLIILTRKTKVVDQTGMFQDQEKMLFNDLRYSKLGDGSESMVLGNDFYAYAEYRQTTRRNSEFDLSETQDADYSDIQPEFRIKIAGTFNNHLQAFGQLRLRKKYFFNAGPLDPDGRRDPPAEDAELNITQLYFLARNIGDKGFSIQIGRQDIDEEREWLFDAYLDAIRIYYYGQAPVIAEVAYIDAVSPLKKKYDTWQDFFAQVRVLTGRNSRARLYLLTRKDSSIRNREPVWYGAGYYGEFEGYGKLWGELAILRGEDKGEPQKASALDIGGTYKIITNKFRPSVTLSYAKGSGDKDSGDSESNEFRQTGYDDNVDYFGGITTSSYYGELLDPELSNIIIKTIAVGAVPTYNTSIDLIYHIYTQDQPNDKLRSDLIDPPARPNSVSDDIGREIDLAFGMVNIWGRVDISWILGIFSPGEAFSPRQETAVLNRFNLKVRI